MGKLKIRQYIQAANSQDFDKVFHCTELHTNTRYLVQDDKEDSKPRSLKTRGEVSEVVATPPPYRVSREVTVGEVGEVPLIRCCTESEHFEQERKKAFGLAKVNITIHGLGGGGGGREREREGERKREGGGEREREREGGGEREKERKW